MKKEKGITLIALVITIVVMLVLVGVTVTSIINSDLISKAKETGAQTKEASEAEPGQADDLLNSALGLFDNDIEVLREFFGKGMSTVGWLDELNANIEPIPDAPTSIKYLWHGGSEDDLVAYFTYNGKIYEVEDDEGDYGNIIKKNYSDLFTDVALQGTMDGYTDDSRIIFNYNNTSYALNFETGYINRYYLIYSGDSTIKLSDFNYNTYDILSSYNPRLWIEDEEVTVTLVQDELGRYCINIPSEYWFEDYRVMLTINEEIVEGSGNLCLRT